MRNDGERSPTPGDEAFLQAVRTLGRLGRPGSGHDPETLLVVDTHHTMEIWSRTTADLAAELTRLGLLGTPGVVGLLGTDDTDPGRIRLEHPSAGSRTRALLVVTDGLAAGWRSGAVLPLLRTWGRSGPVAVVHLLPQHLWFRTGLDVTRIGVRAPHAWAANGELAWEPHRAPLDPVGVETPGRAGAVPVPVLELAERWISPWADLVAGRASGRLEMSAVLAREWKRRPDRARGVPRIDDVPDPASAIPARERVSEFRAGASPTAFELATRLAAAPLTVPVMRRVAAGMPGAGPVHLSELLMSGLVRAVPTAGGEAAAIAYSFGPGIREELLALGRRSDTARVLHEIRVVLGGPGDGEPLLPSATEPLDSLAMPVVTPRNVAFLRIELTALQALSGRFLRRAKRLGDALRSFDRRNGVSLAKYSASSLPERPDAHPDHPTGFTAPATRAEGDSHTGPVGTDTRSEGAQVRPMTPQTVVEGGRSPQPHVWGNIPPRNPNFTGRLELLELLSDRLREGATAVLPEAIHGMGGVGKTQLAIEYAYRHQAEYDVVWWIPSERPGQIGQAFVELAPRLGLQTSPEANVAVPAVREALRAGQPYARWLLIFDNADSPERVRQYFPAGGSGTILVTSRNRRWGLIGGSLEVDVFTREESKELLGRSGSPLEDTEADLLAEALGDLPLALEQAAAWHAETGMPVAEYLRLFEGKRSELLEVSPPLDYQLPVAAAWNVSLDHLETRSPAALRLLQLCSCFAPDPIARSIFSGLGNGSIVPELDAALNDPMRLARAIREINRYSLARIDHGTNSIEMHRLVQAVLNNRMTVEERVRMRRGAHMLLAAADPKAPPSAANWPRYAELYSHVMASRAVESDQPWVRQLVMNVAKYLYYWGDHEVSLEFSEQAWKAWRDVFGEEDQQTRLMGQWLGFLYLVVGRHRDAARFVARLQQVYARTAPPDREDTREDALDALNLEAAVRRVEGDFSAGRALDETVYDRARRAFGEEDPTTLNVAHNLGVSLRLTGDFRQALELDRRTYALKVRLFGRGHQQTLVTEGSIAIDVRETGDYVGARTLQQAVLDSHRTVFGSGNPATIRAMRNLSEACRKEGDHVAALDLARQVSTRFSRRYGDTHPESLYAALALSVALRQNGELEAARELGEKSCDRSRRIFAPQHPHALSTDVDLAVTLRLLGRVEEAYRLDEAALTGIGGPLGRDHPTALACAINLASDMSALGRRAEARELGEETLSLSRVAQGEDHPTTLVCAANLSLDLIALGRGEEGAALRADTLERLVRVLDTPLLEANPDGHPATIQVRAGERANCDIDPMGL